MDKLAARALISNALIDNPQNVIAKAILFNPAASAAMDDLNNVSGPIAGAAAATLKVALRGATNEATDNNMIRFAEFLAA